MWLELAHEADPLVLSLAAGGGLLALGLLIRRSVRRNGAAKAGPEIAPARAGEGAAGFAGGSPQSIAQVARPAAVEAQRAPATIATPSAATISFGDAFVSAAGATPVSAPLAPARAAAPSKPCATTVVQPLPSAAAVAATMAAAEAARGRKRT